MKQLKKIILILLLLYIVFYNINLSIKDPYHASKYNGVDGVLFQCELKK